jgi:hypothetical protein
VSVDPLQHELPDFSSYQYAGNNPITLTDINGAYPGNGPDKFEVNASKANSSEILSDGTRVTYVSGESSDIEMYQQMFEESGTLDFNNRGQINSYFESVYGVRPYGWAPRGEFGNEANRNRIISLFEQAGAFYGVDPSILFTYAMGEGMYYLRDGSAIENNTPIDSFKILGLDFFGSDWTKYNLPSNFKSGGTTPFGKYPNFGSATHFTITQANGNPLVRNEAGGPTNIYPVYFRDIETAIIGASGIYSGAYNKAISSAQDLGWSNLTENQNVFYGYYKIQYPNRELTYYGNTSANFLNGNVKFDLTNQDPLGIPSKSYRRWIEWRYIKLSGYFSK